MKKLLLPLIMTCLILSACDDVSTPVDEKENSVPFASAGVDRPVEINSSYSLYGGGSTDADDDVLSYNWSIASAPTGSTASLSNGASERPSIIPDLAGEYTIQLMVNDGTADSDMDEVILTGYEAISNPRIYAACDQQNIINLYNIGSDSLTQQNLNSLSNPYGFYVDEAAGKLYWTDYGTGKIQRCNSDGTEMEDLITTGLEMPAGIALDERTNMIYWADFGNNTIKRANVNGSDVEILLGDSAVSSPLGLVLDRENNYIYFSDEGTGKIQRADMDGENLTDIATGLSSPHGVVYSAEQQKLFWANWVENNGTVQCCDLNGSNLTTLVSNVNYATGITIDEENGKLYYNNSSELRSCNFDGSDDAFVISLTHHYSFLFFVATE